MEVETRVSDAFDPVSGWVADWGSLLDGIRFVIVKNLRILPGLAAGMSAQMI
jgi:hypothetical protein